MQAVTMKFTTLNSARWTIMYAWGAGSMLACLLAFMHMSSIAPDVRDGYWAWLFSTFLPTMGLIIGVLQADAIQHPAQNVVAPAAEAVDTAPPPPRAAQVTTPFFQLVLVVIFLYFLVLLITMSKPGINPSEISKSSSAYLAPIQAVVAGMIGTLFARPK